MNQQDKAYYLQNMELALLLSVKGMNVFYGFLMDTIKKPEQAAVYRALFDLEKKELISVDDNRKVTILPELDQLLEEMKAAKRLLLYTDRFSEFPDQCIYLGDGGGVFVSSYGTTGMVNRLEMVCREALADKICENGFCLKEMINDESLFTEKQIRVQELEEMAERFFLHDLIPFEEADWGKAVRRLKLVCLKNGLKSGENQKQYLLIRDRLNDYFAVTDETTCIYPYSGKLIMETLKKDLTGE